MVRIRFSGSLTKKTSVKSTEVFLFEMHLEFTTASDLHRRFACRPMILCLNSFPRFSLVLHLDSLVHLPMMSLPL